jgi:hypothetical protein
MTNPLSPPQSIRVLTRAGVHELDFVLALAPDSNESTLSSSAVTVFVEAVVPLATPLPFYVLDGTRHYTGLGPGPDGVWLLILAPLPADPKCRGNNNDNNNDSNNNFNDANNNDNNNNLNHANNNNNNNKKNNENSGHGGAEHAMLVCRAGVLDLWTVQAPASILTTTAANNTNFSSNNSASFEFAAGTPQPIQVAESTLTLAPRRTAPRTLIHAPASNTTSTTTTTTTTALPPQLLAAEIDALRHTVRAALRLRGLSTTGSDELYTQTLMAARYALTMAKQRATAAGNSSSGSARRKSTVELAQVQETVDALLTLFLGE